MLLSTEDRVDSLSCGAVCLLWSSVDKKSIMSDDNLILLPQPIEGWYELHGVVI
jgi:hypothetical protein